MRAAPRYMRFDTTGTLVGNRQRRTDARTRAVSAAGPKIRWRRTRWWWQRRRRRRRRRCWRATDRPTTPNTMARGKRGQERVLYTHARTVSNDLRRRVWVGATDGYIDSGETGAGSFVRNIGERRRHHARRLSRSALPPLMPRAGWTAIVPRTPPPPF